MKISDKLSKAANVLTPKLWNSEAGVGFLNIWVSSDADLMAIYIKDVLGIGTSCVKTSTVSATLPPFIFEAYILWHL